MFHEKYEQYKKCRYRDNMLMLLVHHQNGQRTFEEDKLNTLCENMMIEPEEVIEALDEGNMFAAYILAKDPTKQNIQEQFQADWVNGNVGYPAITLLPKKNKKSFTRDNLKTRSVDAEVWMKDETFYATMKLITGDGGAQDSSRQEVQKFLSIASEMSDKRVIAIVDDSINKHDNEWYLQGVKDRNKALVFSSETLVSYIKY